MSKKKNFTKIERHLIKQCMIDADIIGLGKHETIEYVKSRLNLDFSERSYKKYRSEILNNNNDDDDQTFHGYHIMLEKALLNFIVSVL